MALLFYTSTTRHFKIAPSINVFSRLSHHGHVARLLKLLANKRGSDTPETTAFNLNNSQFQFLPHWRLEVPEQFLFRAPSKKINCSATFLLATIFTESKLRLLRSHDRAIPRRVLHPSSNPFRLSLANFAHRRSCEQPTPEPGSPLSFHSI